MNRLINHRYLILLAAAGFLPSVGAQAQQGGAGSSQDKQLEEILVSAEIQPFRGGVPLEDTAQSVQIMSDELLNNIGISDLGKALDLSGSVARQNNFGGVWDSFAIRGFAGDENVPSGYLINGFAAGRGFSGVRDASNIKRVEIIKGPGSALFGRSEPGGTVNIVTKKPQFEREGYISISAARYDTYRFEGDYTDAITDNLAFRINGAYEEGDSYRDTVSYEKTALTPSLVWLPTDDTTLTYELEIIDQEIPFDRGIVAPNNNLGTVPVSRFLGSPNDGPMEIEAMGHQLMVEHELGNSWRVLGAFGYRDSSLKGFSSDTELCCPDPASSPGRQLLFQDGETVNRQRRHRDYQTEDTTVRFELSGDVETGPITHHLLMGADAYTFDYTALQDRWRVDFGAGDDTYAINLFNPVYGGPQPVPTPMSYLEEEHEAWGVYLQNQIDITEKFRVMLGVRHDDFERDVTDLLGGGVATQEDTQLSPRGGVVYEITPANQLYLSYSEGFRPNSGADFQNNPFDPEESKSYEAGIKFGTEDGRMGGTLAFFKAEKSNILTADPVNAGFSAALGEAESTGVELDFSGQLTDSTMLWFSYAYVDAHTTNNVVNFDWGVNVPKGSQLVNIPEHSASLSLIQDFSIGDTPASGGVNVRYVDERPGDTIDPSYTLPSYTLVDVFLSFQVTSNLELRAEMDNLFDKEHYLNSYSALWTFPGQPRTGRVVARYRF